MVSFDVTLLIWDNIDVYQKEKNLKRFKMALKMVPDGSHVTNPIPMNQVR